MYCFRFDEGPLTGRGLVNDFRGLPRFLGISYLWFKLFAFSNPLSCFRDLSFFTWESSFTCLRKHCLCDSSVDIDIISQDLWSECLTDLGCGILLHLRQNLGARSQDSFLLRVQGIAHHKKSLQNLTLYIRQLFQLSLSISSYYL